jgi:prepilin-type processing-associated H-X9-DG protein
MEASPNSFTKYGSSYEWDPVFDNEPVNETVVYITPTVAIPVNSSRVRLAMDFTPIHNGRPNVVYGDGHVASH